MVFVLKNSDYRKDRYGQTITKEELAYLTIHTRRIQPNIKDDESCETATVLKRQSTWFHRVLEIKSKMKNGRER